MAEKTLIERRRIIYSALARYLREDRLFEALWLWEQKYATTNSLEIRKFVSEIIHGDDSSDLRSKIYKSLTKATYFSIDSDLLPDPYKEMQKYRDRIKGSFKYIDTSLSTISVPFATVVFEQVLKSFLLQLQRKNAVNFEKILFALQGNLAGLNGEATHKLELKNWLNKKTALLKLAYSEAFMRDVVNELYVICCEQHGPVISDKMLSTSIDNASGLDEARFFDPRKLL